MSRRRGKLAHDDYDDGYDDYDPADYEEVGYGQREEQEQMDPHAPPPGYRTDLSAVVAGSHVAGCFTEDNVWYPAVVGELIPGEGGEPTQYFVTYTQYGNSELLPPGRVRAEPASGAEEAEMKAAEEAAAVEATRAAEERAQREVRLEKDMLAGVGASPLYGVLGVSSAGEGGEIGAAAEVVRGTDWDEATIAVPKVSGGVGGLGTAMQQFAFDEPSPDDVVLAARKSAGRTIKKGGGVPPGAVEAKGGGSAGKKGRAPIVKKKGAGAARDAGKAMGTELFKSGEEMRAAPRAAGSEPSGRKKKGGAASGKKAVAAAAAQADKEDTSTKRRLNLVVAGHVDAGKSTLMGRLLFELGSVSQRTMHKFEKESAAIGKSSFKWAWVLDETDGERARGVTMDVGVTHFETDAVRFTLLDAPGHRDFIPKMIDGATQADCGVLVVNSVAGEFETGLDKGGQTREHARLLRSVGVYELIVACNKMDDGGWSQQRYDEIVAIMRTFLATCGFKVDKKVTFIPTSGLTGANLKLGAAEIAGEEASWYSGPTLLQALDTLATKVRTDGPGSAAALAGGPLRLCVTDIYKSQALNGLAVSGKIESGALAVGDRVVALPGPAEDEANVKGILRLNKPVTAAVAGDTVEIGITGVDEVGFATAGCVLCHPDSQITQARKLRATVYAFDTLETPITKGFPAVLYAHGAVEPCVVSKLLHVVNSAGEVQKDKLAPRALTAGKAASLVVTLDRSMAMEEFATIKSLGRFMLRAGDVTVAQGMVTKMQPG